MNQIDDPLVAENVRYWIATAPVGAASVLAEELAQFGATDIKERSHDVKFQGTLEVGYRACLWSRTATRVLLSLGSIDATSSKNIYEAVKRMDWREHLAPGGTQRRRESTFLRQADSAMYRAKAAGRNRVEVADPED